MSTLVSLYMTGVSGFDEIKQFAERQFSDTHEIGQTLLIHDGDSTIELIPGRHHGVAEMLRSEGEDEIALFKSYLGVEPSYALGVHVFRAEGSMELARRFAEAFMDQFDAIFSDHHDRIWTAATLPKWLN